MMGNMFPTGKELLVVIAIIAIVGWAAITGLIKLAVWLFQHIAINFI